MDELKVWKNFLICNGHKSTTRQRQREKKVDPFSQRAEIPAPFVHMSIFIFRVRVFARKWEMFWQN